MNTFIFNEKTHTYYLNDKKLISVTTFIKSLFNEFDSDKIIDYILKSNKMNNPDYEYYNMNKLQIFQLWKKQTLLGTLLHKDIENYYNGLTINNNSIEYGYFLNFINDNNNLIPFKFEWKIFSKKIKIAGMIDMIYKCEDKYIICDYKRSKGININQNYGNFCTYPNLTYIPDTNYYHYAFQLNLYKYILEEEYNIKIDSMFLLVLHPNNKNYIKYEICNLQKEIKIIINI